MKQGREAGKRLGEPQAKLQEKCDGKPVRRPQTHATFQKGAGRHDRAWAKDQKRLEIRDHGKRTRFGAGESGECPLIY